eukprot:gene9086-6532_t
MDELDELVASAEGAADLNAEGVLNQVVEASEQLYAEDIEINRAIGYNGAKRILELVKRDKIRVLTICNTGSLATAGFGTALGVVRALHELGKLEHVYACETRPYNQGARLTAYEIVQDRLPGTLITDNMASALMAVKGVDVVVIGADRVAGNGDTANKIGSYQLAIAAKYHRIPFFTALPTTTIDVTMASGIEIHVEERPAHELTSIFGQKIAPDGIAVWNPAFDVTPCALITGVITELGVIEPEHTEQENASTNSDHIIPVAAYLKRKTQENPTKFKNLIVRLGKAVQPIATPIGYARMDAAHIKHYVAQQGLLTQRLQLTAEDIANIETSVDVKEVGDGNLNFVYIVTGRNNAQFVLKQALPYKVIFTDPYTTSALNHWTSPQLDETVQALQADIPTKRAAAYFKQRFLTATQALVHGDLHTGSVMAKEGSTYVIDPEFAFYGPMGFDLGQVVGNLFFSYFAHTATATNEEAVAYADWVLSTIVTFYQVFERQFGQLWSEQVTRTGGSGELYVAGVYPADGFDEIQREFFQDVWRDTLGFAATEVIRRIVGVAHVADLESIADPEVRVVAEKRALTFAQAVLISAHRNAHVSDITALVAQAKATVAAVL